MAATRPGRSDITSTRSARNTASGMLWVISSTVLRVRSQMRCSSRFICSRVIASSAPKGSSISRIDGSLSKARQMATRCCMPPDSCQGSLSSKPARPAICNSWCARGRCGRRSSPRSCIGSSRFFSTVRQASSTGVWKTMPTSSSGPSTARPPMSMRPAVAGVSPATIFSSVLLPQPLGPTMTTNSPGSTCRSIGFSDSTAPLRVW